MIITMLIITMIIAVRAFLLVFPNLPATPEPIVSASDYLVDLISGATGVLSMVYSPTLLSALVVVLLATALFDQLYWLAIFILKKVPFINIK